MGAEGQEDGRGVRPGAGVGGWGVGVERVPSSPGPPPLFSVAGQAAGAPSGRRRSPALQPRRWASPLPGASLLPGSPSNPPRPGPGGRAPRSHQAAGRDRTRPLRPATEAPRGKEVLRRVCQGLALLLFFKL